MSTEKSAPLNDKQLRFVHEYLIDMNAAAAARRAGYSPGTRGNQAAALMRNPKVRELIALLMADLFGELKITARELLRERARAAFFRPAKLLDGWQLRPLEEIDEETLSALIIHHDVRPGRPAVTRIRQPDRDKALAALEKAHAHAMEALERSLVPYEAAKEEEEPEEAHTRAAEPAPMPEAQTAPTARKETASLQPIPAPVQASPPALLLPKASAAPVRTPAPIAAANPPRTTPVVPHPIPAAPRTPLAGAISQTFKPTYIPPWDRREPVTQPTLRGRML